MVIGPLVHFCFPRKIYTRRNSSLTVIIHYAILLGVVAVPNESTIFCIVGMRLGYSGVSALYNIINAVVPFNAHTSIVLMANLPSLCVYSILYIGLPVDVEP